MIYKFHNLDKSYNKSHDNLWNCSDILLNHQFLFAYKTLFLRVFLILKY